MSKKLDRLIIAARKANEAYERARDDFDKAEASLEAERLAWNATLKARSGAHAASLEAESPPGPAVRHP